MPQFQHPEVSLQGTSAAGATAKGIDSLGPLVDDLRASWHAWKHCGETSKPRRPTLRSELLPCLPLLSTRPFRYPPLRQWLALRPVAKRGDVLTLERCGERVSLVEGATTACLFLGRVDRPFRGHRFSGGKTLVFQSCDSDSRDCSCRPCGCAHHRPPSAIRFTTIHSKPSGGMDSENRESRSLSTSSAFQRATCEVGVFTSIGVSSHPL